MENLSDLMPREMESLQLVLAGPTNKAIGGQICIREKTIEFYLDHVFIKIGVQTRYFASWVYLHFDIAQGARK